MIFKLHIKDKVFSQDRPGKEHSQHILRRGDLCTEAHDTQNNMSRKQHITRCGRDTTCSEEARKDDMKKWEEGPCHKEPLLFSSYHSWALLQWVKRDWLKQKGGGVFHETRKSRCRPPWSSCVGGLWSSKQADGRHRFQRPGSLAWVPHAHFPESSLFGTPQLLGALTWRVWGACIGLPIPGCAGRTVEF